MPVKPEEAADERQRPERRSGQHVEQVERQPGEPRADRQQGQAGRARAEQLEALIRSARELQPELQKRPAD
ncbi:MAG: hypothetical protein OXI73_01370 [Rhodospirillales bacterium]|nr:hypothetical protein [Rhodospirillales bacterium]